MAPFSTDNRGLNEKYKFVELPDGNTGVRTQTYPAPASGAQTTYSATGTSVSGAASLLGPKTEIVGKKGGYTLGHNADGPDITVKVYVSYKETPVEILAANWEDDWDQIGSDITLASGTTEVTPFQNDYRHIGATGVTATGSATVDVDLWVL